MVTVVTEVRYVTKQEEFEDALCYEPHICTCSCGVIQALHVDVDHLDDPRVAFSPAEMEVKSRSVYCEKHYKDIQVIPRGYLCFSLLHSYAVEYILPHHRSLPQSSSSQLGLGPGGFGPPACLATMI